MSLSIVLTLLLSLCTTLHSKQSSVLRSLTTSHVTTTRRKLLASFDTIWDEIFKEIKWTDLPQIDNLIQQLNQISNNLLSADQQTKIFQKFQDEKESNKADSSENKKLAMTMFYKAVTYALILEKQTYLNVIFEYCKAVSAFAQSNKVYVMNVFNNAVINYLQEKKDDLLQIYTVAVLNWCLDAFNQLTDMMEMHKADFFETIEAISMVYQVFQTIGFSNINIMILIGMTQWDLDIFKHQFSSEEITKIIDSLCDTLPNTLQIIGNAINQEMSAEDKKSAPYAYYPVYMLEKNKLAKLLRNMVEIAVTFDNTLFTDYKEADYIEWISGDKFKELYMVIRNELGKQKAKKITCMVLQLTYKGCANVIERYEDGINDGLSQTTLIIIIVCFVTGVVLIGIVIYFWCKRKI